MAKNHGFPKGYIAHIIDAVSQHVPAGVELALTEEQAASRRATPVEDKPGVYILKYPTQLKRGEIVGLAGEPPKGTALVPVEKAAEAPKEPLKGPQKPGNAPQGFEPKGQAERPKGLSADEGRELALLQQLKEPDEKDKARLAELSQKLTGKVQE